MLKGNATLKFGTGDINVVSGYKIDGSAGLVAFRNQEPREIFVNNGDEPLEDFNDYDVKMEFTNIRSFDVVINALQQAKEMMIHKCARCEYGNPENMYCEIKDSFINKHECNVCEDYVRKDYKK